MVSQRVGVGGARLSTWSFGLLIGAHVCVATFTSHLVLGAARCGGSCFDWSFTSGSKTFQINVSIVLLRRGRLHACTKAVAGDTVNS